MTDDHMVHEHVFMTLLKVSCLQNLQNLQYLRKNRGFCRDVAQAVVKCDSKQFMQ